MKNTLTTKSTETTKCYGQKSWPPLMVARYQIVMCKNTMKLFFFILTVLIIGCSSDNEQRLYTDPLSGEEMIFNITSKDGWDLHTSSNGKMLLIVRNGKTIAIVADFKTGREVSVMNHDQQSGLLSIRDKDFDNVYETIRYGNGDVEVIDSGLDGNIDGILNFSEKTMYVNYQGQMNKLLGERKEKYLIIEGKRINMKYIDGIFVPNGK